MRLKILLLLITGTAISCSQDNEEDLTPPTCDTTPANMRYSTTVTSILSANGCYGCHGGAAASGAGIALGTYAGVKAMADNGRLAGAINHAQGFSPMPKGGAKMSDCDIDKIEAWIAAGAQNN